MGMPGYFINPEFDKALETPGPDRPEYHYAVWDNHHEQAFTFGEPVVVTELVAGLSVRATVEGGTLYVGSGDEWKQPQASSPYWKAFRWATNLEKFLRTFPGSTAYGKAYGIAPALDYDRRGQVAFVLTDLLAADGQWVSHDKARHMTRPYELPWEPVIARCGYKPSLIEELAEGPSLLVAPSNDPSKSVQRCFGAVVKTPIERVHPHTGRTVFTLYSRS